MPSLKDIRKRIGSVKNTRQITRAMKMVAAAKLRRSQEAVVSARPYAYRIYSMLYHLVNAEGAQHPLLVQTSGEKKIKLVVLAGERGLCGSFNANILKEAARFIKEKELSGIQVAVDVIGKKAFDFFRKRREVAYYHEKLLTAPRFAQVGEVADKLLSDYREGSFDAVYLVYNEFKSAIQQKTVVEKLVPISMDPPQGVLNLLEKQEASYFDDYKFEPSQAVILSELIPRHFKMQLFRAVLESVASEHGSRMSAMESATKNASELIEGLTLEYNKARQASITKELMEIIGGVEAMK